MGTPTVSQITQAQPNNVAAVTAAVTAASADNPHEVSVQKAVSGGLQ